MNHRNKYRNRFRMFPLLLLVAALAMGGIVMLLWNAILPSLLNVSQIKYWQAVGLLALCRILFGNFGGRMGGPPRWNNFQKGNQEQSENDEPNFGPRPWRGKWMNMTNEERQQFRDEMKRRCGGRGRDFSN